MGTGSGVSVGLGGVDVGCADGDGGGVTYGCEAGSVGGVEVPVVGC